MSITVGLTLEHFERIFGKFHGVQRGRYVIDPDTGRSLRVQDMTAEQYGAWRERQRTPSTRNNIISDIKPFRTGVGAGAQTIGSRREMRAYMDRHELTPFEAMPERPAYQPDEAGIVDSIKQAMEMDPAEREPVAPREAAAWVDSETTTVHE